MLPEVREPEKSGDGNAIFLRDPYPDDPWLVLILF